MDAERHNRTWTIKIIKATTIKDWVRVLRHTTPLTHINLFTLLARGGLPGAGT
jgi:hypothetical protein